ncbi:hypothetical protein BTO04_01775 [Polaribacter sp. SA4-10]|uniref:glycosyltransferase family 2 protein n=1 Tax=Polaribacter sp. SA4-10 TaxID=754397 RepID=UPI000B3C7D3F|nr:glycosyltransferase family 2 protein [Polaribacter sp. SA4-10]ARV05499.1 hypothetical protein BTO04_01775 [Polaribacter sp. SA4-10]
MISVIIPIYNAEKHLKKAISSALIQKEVREIILIDDGSTDNSRNICLEKEKSNSRIKLYCHQKNKNLGRSASRNLGIKKTTSKYIAFLDADDFYLPNRFKNDLKLFTADETIDGVYNAIGSHFYRESSEIDKRKLSITTISERISPEELFEKMGPMGHFGYFSGIGLTIKKDALLKTNLFNENLKVAEDTELWLKMSLVLKLCPGIINTPVSLRGVHEKNTSFNDEDLYKQNNLIMYQSLLDWMFYKKIPFKRIILIWKKIWTQNIINKTSFANRMKYWIKIVSKHPILLKSVFTYKYFPILRLLK